MEEVHETLVLTIRYTTCSVTVASLIYGVVSWCVLEKFRNYRNYVCLNAILANLLYVALYVNFHNILWLITGKDNIRIVYAAMSIVTDFLAAVKHHWLVVLCHMFYVDVVKVFNGDIQGRYLKSSLFGWVAPLILIGIHVSVGFIVLSNNINIYDWPVPFIIPMLPLLLNVLLYIVIVFTLFRGSKATTLSTNKWRRFYIATLIFILSDVVMLSTYAFVFFKQDLINGDLHVPVKDAEPNFYLAQGYALLWSPSLIINNLIGHGTLYEYVELVIFFLNPIALAVFLVTVKSNRALWYEFYVSRLNERLSKKHLDIKMQERVVREPADSRPVPAVSVIQNHNCVTHL